MKQFLVAPVLILLLVILINPKGFSQDRIVLVSGDTIHCTINKVSKKYLFYSQDYNGVSAKGKILKSKIREWSYFVAKDESKKIPENLLTVMEDKDSETKTEIENRSQERGKFRISIIGGPGYLVGNTGNAEKSLQDQGVSISDSKKYYNNLKLGAQTKASVYFHAWGDYWFGALYHGFYSKSEIITPMQLDEVNMYYGKLGEHYFVNFAGATFFSADRYGRKKQIGLSSSFSVGPAFYRDELEMLNEQVLIQGTSLATNISIGAEYFIKPHFSISLETSLFSSQVKKLKVTTTESSQDVELDKENYENISRLDLSLGIVYYW